MLGGLPPTLPANDNIGQGKKRIALVEGGLPSPFLSLSVVMCGTRTPVREDIRDKIGRVRHAVGEIFYGMTTFDWVRGMRRERGEVERLFVLITFGDLVGLPILPPYYTLRLLPYVVPAINRWKRSLLRERDWTDLAGLIEGIG